jgi:hypothetical protein
MDSFLTAYYSVLEYVLTLSDFQGEKAKEVEINCNDHNTINTGSLPQMVA